MNDIRKAAIFGAGGGIGAAIADALERRGTDVVRVARRGGPEPFDLTDESTIAGTADRLRKDPPELVVVATGILTLADGRGPERSMKAIDPETMARVLAINTIGPALVAKHVLPLLRRDRRSVFAMLSARVGSIGDNRLGGWHSYRASKAALNMLIRNFAIEAGRTHPEAVVCGLHPGTVDTELSRPFQSSVPEEQLTTPTACAANLLDVIASLAPKDSGGVFDWRGLRVPD